MAVKVDLEDGGYAEIVEAAKGLGLEFEDEHPLDSGEEVIEAAKWLIDSAKQAYEEGARGKAVETILTMAGEIEEEPEAEAAPEAEPEPEQEKEGPSSYKDHVEEKPKTRRKPRAKKADAKDEDESQFMNMPIPGDWEGDYPEIPVDMSTLKDSELQSLYSKCGFILSRVTWLVGRERSRVAHAEHLRDLHYTKALAGQEEGTEKVRIANATLDEDVVKLDASISEHKQAIAKLQALRDVFDGNVERISREWTMRTDSFNKERTPSVPGVSK